jgi:hypothetical protein
MYDIDYVDRTIADMILNDYANYCTCLPEMLLSSVASGHLLKNNSLKKSSLIQSMTLIAIYSAT